MNEFLLAGRLVKTPELRASKDGEKKYTFITLAINGKDKSDFFDITVFGKTAEIIVQYCEKGCPLTVKGFLRQGTKENGYKITLIADKVFFGNKKEN